MTDLMEYAVKCVDEVTETMDKPWRQQQPSDPEPVLRIKRLAQDLQSNHHVSNQYIVNELHLFFDWLSNEDQAVTTLIEMAGDVIYQGYLPVNDKEKRLESAIEDMKAVRHDPTYWEVED